MNREEIKTMISLIEDAYPRRERNTPSKMAFLIEREFEILISPSTVSNICGLGEDYESESWKIGNS